MAAGAEKSARTSGARTAYCVAVNCTGDPAW
jgi:hypothetical protein